MEKFLEQILQLYEMEIKSAGLTRIYDNAGQA